MLESAFQHLYELNFQAAREDIASYHKQRPEDPLGKATEAATYLFEQFNDKGVLTLEFFLNDSRFLGGIEGSLSEIAMRRFSVPTVRHASSQRSV
jgi:hypothetical protein